MINLNASVSIFRPIQQVFDFISDTENDFQWQYGTLESARVSAGDVGVGAFFRSIGHVMGRRLLGTFQVHRLAAVLATSGIIFAAVYLLWMYQRVCFGEVTHEANRRLVDLTPRKWAVLLPVLLFIVWIGVYPTTFTTMTEPSVQALITQVQTKAQATSALLMPRP